MSADTNRELLQVMGWRAWDAYDRDPHARWRALPWRERYSWKFLRTVLALAVAIATLLWVTFANARNVYCHPGMPTIEWDGLRWEFSGYFGPLTEVTISSNSGPTIVTCVRKSVGASAFPKGKCRFRVGTKVSIRTLKKMSWQVCKTAKDMNVDECVVECDDQAIGR